MQQLSCFRGGSGGTWCFAESTGIPYQIDIQRCLVGRKTFRRARLCNPMRTSQTAVLSMLPGGYDNPLPASRRAVLTHGPCPRDYPAAYWLKN